MYPHRGIGPGAKKARERTGKRFRFPRLTNALFFKDTNRSITPKK